MAKQTSKTGIVEIGVGRVLREQVTKLVGREPLTGRAADDRSQARRGVPLPATVREDRPVLLPMLEHPPLPRLGQVDRARPAGLAARLVRASHGDAAGKVNIGPVEGPRLLRAAAGLRDESQDRLGVAQLRQRVGHKLRRRIAGHPDRQRHLRLARHHGEPALVVGPRQEPVCISHALADRPQGVPGVLEVAEVRVEHVNRQFRKWVASGEPSKRLHRPAPLRSLGKPRLHQSGDTNRRPARRPRAVQQVGRTSVGVGAVGAQVVFVVLMGQRVPRPATLGRAAANFGRTWHDK